MKVTLNGKAEILSKPLKLNELIVLKGLKSDTIVVEQNGLIIEKSNYPTTKLNENDIIEIVSFVGGG